MPCTLILRPFCWSSLDSFGWDTMSRGFPHGESFLFSPLTAGSKTLVSGALVNRARGLAKSYGERRRGCNVRNMNPEKASGLSPELQTALEPLLAGIESLSDRIREYNEGSEKLAQERYPPVVV